MSANVDVYLGDRPDDHDPRPMIVERGDVIDAAGALVQLARAEDRLSRSRSRSPYNTPAARQQHGRNRDRYRAAADRLQRIADAA